MQQAGFSFTKSRESDHSDTRQLDSRVAKEPRHIEDCGMKARKFHVRKEWCERAKLSRHMWCQRECPWGGKPTLISRPHQL